MYPAKWQNRKLILGLNNREEFRTAPAADEVERIVTTARRRALYITKGCTALSVILLFLHGMILQTFIWTVFIFAAIFAETVPFIMGHRDLMAVKRRLGIASGKGISFADLKAAGSVHALKPGRVLVPNLLGLAVVVFALLVDLGVINMDTVTAKGSFLGTIMVTTYWLTGVLITFFAYLMGNMKNTVISTDSDINANYNRAKKKNLADLNVLFLWLNTILIFAVYLLFMMGCSEMMLMFSIGIYIAIMMIYMALFVRGNSRIEARYIKELSLVSDDDEYWIGGLIYYNPTDTRAMVEKRAGIGTTVNYGHPLGKVSAVFMVLILAATALLLIWLGMLDVVPVSLRLEDDKLICHQLRDEYVIVLDDIVSAELDDELSEHKIYRTFGVGMGNLLKGDFTVDGKSGCKFFMNPAGKAYIRIETADGKCYYISGETAEDTNDIYKELERYGR
ncbi:MAG: DUF5808 domain-containing protein [Lachnospiraceae bacterium]|nr:DUF5808 domain-containing protein [Lachnospiraceae bacterium]